ncbi:MAG: hypothetical protein K0R18_2344 [Bacillales bacterium]|jgi:metal-sulfur cluster biosynthetic enzyme|nr:hypothetical protein [Bacillales bacterium]MDF2946288.1 hypothetical protein [Bacillales bacterium]
MEELKDSVYRELHKVIDPELDINIVDLGLVYDVNIDTNNNVQIEMTLTTPGCPLHDSIVSGVKNVVRGIDGINNVDVDVVWEPAWTPERMSQAALKILGH